MRRILLRLYLFVFVLAILGWIILSSIEFFNGTGSNFPLWMETWPPISRVVFLAATTNIYYFFIALGLFIEFLRPRIQFGRFNGRMLSALGVIMIANALIVGWNNELFFGNSFGLIDTVIYGLGFGILFLFSIPQRTVGLSLILWTRFIEVGGFFIGYFLTPALLNMWPRGYTLGHFTQGPAFMFTNYFFWTDYITAIGSLIGVIILLRKFKFSRFWITSFLIGSIIVGHFIARYIISNF